MQDKFNEEDLKFFLPNEFKKLSKEYIISCVFNENIQKNWNPQKGDIIVGCTGNIFVISKQENLNDVLGGTRWYFGGGMCNRDGGNLLDETYCHTANESGEYYGWLDGKIQKQDNCYHSCIRNFRYVPYPHEHPDFPKHVEDLLRLNKISK